MTDARTPTPIDGSNAFLENSQQFPLAVSKLFYEASQTAAGSAASVVLLQKKCILQDTLNMFSIKSNAQPFFTLVLTSGSGDRR